MSNKEPHLCDAVAMLIQALGSLPVHSQRASPACGKRPAILHAPHEAGHHHIPIWCALLLCPRPAGTLLCRRHPSNVIWTAGSLTCASYNEHGSLKAVQSCLCLRQHITVETLARSSSRCLSPDKVIWRSSMDGIPRLPRILH